MQADPPDPSKIREEDIIGVTVLLLTCSYMGQEFMRVGYYVNNDYDDEQLREEPPTKVLIDRVQRNILADKPRVTKFPINFHPEPSTSTGQQQEQQTASPENHTGRQTSLMLTNDRSWCANILLSMSLSRCPVIFQRGLVVLHCTGYLWF